MLIHALVNSIRCGSYHNMEDYTNILKLEELIIKYQKKAESSREWVHHLQVVCLYNFIILIDQLIKY